MCTEYNVTLIVIAFCFVFAVAGVLLLVRCFPVPGAEGWTRSSERRDSCKNGKRYLVFDHFC